MVWHNKLKEFCEIYSSLYVPSTNAHFPKCHQQTPPLYAMRISNHDMTNVPPTATSVLETLCRYYSKTKQRSSNPEPSSLKHTNKWGRSRTSTSPLKCHEWFVSEEHFQAQYYKPLFYSNRGVHVQVLNAWYHDPKKNITGDFDQRTRANITIQIITEKSPNQGRIQLGTWGFSWTPKLLGEQTNCYYLN
jgi:hypothetical protein